MYIQYILYIRTIREAGQIKPVHKYVSSKNKKSFFHRCRKDASKLPCLQQPVSPLSPSEDIGGHIRAQSVRS